MKIVAFLDASLYAPSVVDHALWLARGRSASVELVHIVSPGELRSMSFAPMHPSAAMVQLPDEDIDRKVAELKREAHRRLEAVRELFAAAGVDDVITRVHEGNVLELMKNRATDASIVVMGKRGDEADLAHLTLGSHVEALVRSVQIPVLAVSRKFRPISRIVLATAAEDNSSPSVEALLRGIVPTAAVRLLHVGDGSEHVESVLSDAAIRLGNAGFEATVQITDGEPRRVIPERLVLDGGDMLVVNAFGSSRMTSLILGSLTAELIRACQVPVLLC